MYILSEFLRPGIGFLLTLVFGFWVGKAGKPYNGLLFNIHKLIALGTVIITGLQVYRLMATLKFPALMIFWLVIAVISVVALFVSGAVMSIGNMNFNVMKAIHNIAPVLAIIAMGMIIYFLNGSA